MRERPARYSCSLSNQHVPTTYSKVYRGKIEKKTTRKTNLYTAKAAKGRKKE